MFEWIKGLFKKSDVMDADDDGIRQVPSKRPYTGYVEDEFLGEQTENEMPIIPEMSKRDGVDTYNIMVETDGGDVQADPSIIQNMLKRPGVPDGLPGMSVPVRRQQNQQGHQGRPMQQHQQLPPQQQNPYQRQQPQQQPQYAPGYQPGYQPQYDPNVDWGNNAPPPYWPNQQQQPPMPPQQQPGYDQQPPPPPPPRPVAQAAQPRKLYPHFEQYSIDNEYHLEIDLPGVEETSLGIEYADSIVTVSGYRENAADRIRRVKNKKKEVSIQDHQCTVPTHLLGKFAFDFPFKKMVDESAITADYANGILHLTLPHRVKGDKVTIGVKKKPTQSQE